MLFHALSESALAHCAVEAEMAVRADPNAEAAKRKRFC